MNKEIDHKEYRKCIKRKLPCIIYYEDLYDKNNMDVSLIMKNMCSKYPKVQCHRVIWHLRHINGLEITAETIRDVLCFKLGKQICKVNIFDFIELETLFQTVFNDSVENSLSSFNKILWGQGLLRVGEKHKKFEIDKPSYIVQDSDKKILYQDRTSIKNKLKWFEEIIKKQNHIEKFTAPSNNVEQALMINKHPKKIDNKKVYDTNGALKIIKNYKIKPYTTNKTSVNSRVLNAQKLYVTLPKNSSLKSENSFKSDVDNNFSFNSHGKKKGFSIASNQKQSSDIILHKNEFSFYPNMSFVNEVIPKPQNFNKFDTQKDEKAKIILFKNPESSDSVETFRS